jgi:autoinducer 2-degrading protein
MYVVTVHFEIRRGHEDAFLARVRRQAYDSLEREAHCYRFDVCRDPDRPGAVFLYEIYGDRQAFDEHLESAHFKDFDREVAAWVADKQIATWRLIEPLETGQ